MNNLLARVKINIRIYMLMIVAALGIVGVIAASAHYIETSLTEARQLQTESLSSTAGSLVNGYIERVKNGQMTEDEAQKHALLALSTLRYDNTNYFFVLKWDGTMIEHPKQELVGKSMLDVTDARGKRLFKDMIAASKTENGLVSYMWKDTDGKVKLKISHVKGVPEWKWTVGTGIYADDIERDVMRVMKRLGILACALLAFAMIIACIIGRSISKPIDQLNSCMQRLADGDTTGEVGMQERRDEIGSMANTVRFFQESLRQIEKLKAEQIERRAAAEKKATIMGQLASDFDQSVGHIVHIVASAATKLQANSKHLSEIADKTNQQSANVAAATEEASSSVSTVASATEELSASIGEINRQVTESSQVAQNAVIEVKKTDETVSTLSEAAAQIGDVVKLIQDIAEQTNLLALNATIEAARAGEAGKGFAVVASEVKNLANQTARATEDISKKIVTVQNVSTDTVGAIRSIGRTIEQMNTITSAIASAIQEQTAATKEISNNVQQASAGTSEVSSNIVGVTQAASEARGAASEVLAASSELSKQSERLRIEIDTFLRNVREA